jgi:hypothetical protein
MINYSLLFVILFCWGRDQSAQGLCWFMFLEWLGEFCMVCGAHLFVLSNDTQAGLKPEVAVVVAAAAARNDYKFSQCNVM